jgi:2'-5' RNA ligase
MRIFAGLPLPADTAGEIADWMRGWPAAGLKTVERGNLHITVFFFGELTEHETRKLVECVGAVRHPRIEAVLGGVGRFPPGGRPRVFYVSLARGAEQVEAVHQLFMQTVAPLGYEEEGRPFRPHITCARVKRGRSPAPPPPFAEPAGRSFVLDRLVLFESRLTPAGPQYHPLETVLLD